MVHLRKTMKDRVFEKDTARSCPDLGHKKALLSTEVTH